jgi:hypothetical protein
VAIHDALNGIDRRSRPYAVNLHAAPGTSPDAAVAAAAHDVLVSVLGSFSFFLPADCINAGVGSVEADYADALDAIPDGLAKAQGIALGQDAAEAILALRASDGYDTPTVNPNYQEGTAPGEYRYTPGIPFAPALGEDLIPFALRDSSQFRPGPPYRLTSRKYAADFNQVKRLGGDDVTTRVPAATSRPRSPSSGSRARHCSGTRSPGTSRPRKGSISGRTPDCSAC